MKVYLSLQIGTYGSDKLVNRIRDGLERGGVTVLPVLPTRRSRRREDWLESVVSALDEADVLVVLVGGDVGDREWQSLEIASAIASGKPVVPVLIDAQAERPLLLRDRQYLDFSYKPVTDQQIDLLLATVRRANSWFEDGQTTNELVDIAGHALRVREQSYQREFREQERGARYLQLIVAMVSVAASVFALLVASSGSRTIVSVVVGGLVVLLPSTFAFYFTSDSKRASTPGSSKAPGKRFLRRR